MKCVLCEETKTIRHHISYEENKTIPICRSCHRHVHSKPDHEFYPKDSPTLGNEKVTIGAKIPHKMEEMIEEIIRRDTHLTKGELTRAALRNYVRNNYPDIFREYTKGVMEDDE